VLTSPGLVDRPRPFGLHQGVDCGDSFRLYVFSQTARTAHRVPPSASLATDHSGRAAPARGFAARFLRRFAPRTGRSGHLASTPAPSAVSVASRVARRTRNRLACWTLAPDGSVRGAGCFSSNPLSLAPRPHWRREREHRRARSRTERKPRLESRGVGRRRRV